MNNCKLITPEFQELQDIDDVISNAVGDFSLAAFDIADETVLYNQLRTDIVNNYIKDKFLKTYAIEGEVNTPEVIQNFIRSFLNSNYIDDERAIPTLEEISLALGKDNIAESEVTVDSTTERIETDNETKTLINDLNQKFMYDAFGYAYATHQFATVLGNSGIINSVFLNREDGIPVTSDLEINQNLRAFQEKLFKIISDYYEFLMGEPLEEGIYKDNHINSLALLKLRNFAKDNLTPEFFTPTKLDLLYNSMMSGKIAEINKLAYNAYVAYTILNNFDTFIELNFGKSIEINPRSKRFTTDNDKYKLADKGDNMNKTFRRTENIDIHEEVDNIVKRLIDTTPRYTYGSSSPLLNTYLSYQQFTTIIWKIKELASSFAPDIYIDETSEIYKRLEDDTKKLVKGVNLKTLISLLSIDTEVLFPVIIDILSEKINSELTLGFTNDDIAIIQSIKKEITSSTGNSIRNIFKNYPSPDRNYYEYITQNVAAIFPLSFLQYLKREGDIYARNMVNLAEDQIRRDIETTINVKNGKINIEIQSDGNLSGWDYLVSKYRISATPIDLTPFAVTFDPLTNTELEGEYLTSVYLDGKTNVKAKRFRKFNELDYLALKPIIIEYLGIELDDSKFENALFSQYLSNGFIDYDTLTSDLFDLVANIIKNQYISNVILKNAKTESDINKKLSSLYSEENRPKINRTLLEINLFEKKDYPKLAKLSRAMVIVKLDGSFTLLLDGQGNSSSTSTFSNVNGNYRALWESQIKYNETAAASLFSILEDGTVTLYKLKELYSLDDLNTKELLDFNALEYVTSQIVYGFLDGLANYGKQRRSDNYVIKDGVIGILPSVNSDKSFIGDLLFNTLKHTILNKKGEITKVSGMLLRYEDNLTYLGILTDKENYRKRFFSIIQEELGNFFNTVVANINDDLRRAFTLIGVPSTISYSASDFSEVNAWAEANNIDLPKELYLRVREYNESAIGRTYPIKLTDLVHYITNGKKLAINPALISQQIIHNNPDILDSFFKLKERLLLKDLVNNKVSILTDSLTRELYTALTLLIPIKDWTDKGELVLGKFTIRDKTYNIKSKKDILAILLLNRLDSNVLNDCSQLSLYGELTLNPLFEKYNLMDYFVTMEWNSSTIGNFYAHPSKGSPKLESLNIGEFTIADGISYTLPTYIETDLAARVDASYKRNVSYTAAVHPFRINTLNGIADLYNVAVIEDLVDTRVNITGETSTVKPTDGGMFVNAFTVILENNSLKGERVGVVKKQFVHAYDEQTGSQIIIKTAGFGHTNELIRGSKLHATLHKKMTDRLWLSRTGGELQINVLNGYRGVIDYSNENSTDGRVFYRDLQTGKYYEILLDECSYNSNNTYTRTIQEVDIKGVPLVDENGQLKKTSSSMTIDTNWKLWDFFGGATSMALIDGQLEFDEHSIYSVVKAMNEIVFGLDTHMNTVQYVQGNKANWKYPVTRQSETIYLPLKHSDIHYACGAGAVKCGASNMNPNTEFASVDANGNPQPLSYMLIKLHLIGIQLDKEHRATGEELSLMTQVVSACISRGYTLDYALELYNGLYLLGEQATDSYRKNTPKEFEQTVVGVILQLAATSSLNNNKLEVIIKPLLDKYKKGETITLLDIKNAGIPYSDSSVFNKIASMISVDLTRKGIKSKIEGLLAMLCPSHDFVKMYGDRTLNDWANKTDTSVEEAILKELSKPKYKIIGSTSIEFNKVYLVKNTLTNEIEEFATDSPDNFDKLRDWLNNGTYRNAIDLEIGLDRQYAVTYPDGTFELKSIGTSEELRDMIDTAESITDISDIAELNLGRSYAVLYTDGTSSLITLTVPQEYHELKKDILEGRVKNVREYILNGRNLGGYNCRFKGLDDVKYQLYDLKSSIDLFRILEIIKLLENKSISTILESNDNLHEKYLLSQLVTILNDNLEDNYTLDRLKEEDIDALIDTLNDLVAAKLRRKVLSDLDSIALGGTVEIFVRDTPEGVISKLVETTGDYEHYAPETILPKKFAEEFGLRKNDSLIDISEDPDFFTNRIIERIGVASEIKAHPENWDLALKRINGKHLYILLRTHLDQFGNINKSLHNTHGLTKKENVYYKKSESKYKDINEHQTDDYVRIDKSTMKEMYTLADVTDEVYEDAQGNEIIVTDDPGFYVDNNNYLTIELSENTKNFASNSYDNYAEELVRNIAKSDNQTALNWAEHFIDFDLDTIVEDIIETNNNINSKEYLRLDKFITTQGREIHTSFLRSLDIIAARIPAQSMLSFMAMKIVGFVESDVNTAYVSTDQIWLQGSDFDIDAVSLAMFAINNSGKYQKWSKYMDLSSIERLRESENFPLPTGKQTYLLDIDFNTWDENVIEKEELFYLNLFNISKITKGKNKGKLRIRFNTDDLALVNRFLRKSDIHYPEKYTLKFAEYLKGRFGITFTSDNIKQLGETIVKVLDGHNMYLKKMKSRGVRNNAIKNFNMHKMYNISADPRNAIESLQSVDSTTGEPKQIASTSSVALEQRTHTYGNFMNKALSIIENLIGKKCVGISANGLKGFFALSLYFFSILNNPNISDEEKYKKLVFKDPITGNKSLLLANTRVKDIEAIKDPKLKEALLNINQDIDAAIVLSALLSLATDNAKELSLAKLNAGVNMLGLYVFGVVAGLSFKEISSIMMSPTATGIKELTEGNSFGVDLGKRNLNTIFSYIEMGPGSELAKLDSVLIGENRHTTVLDLVTQVSILNLIKVYTAHHGDNKRILQDFLNTNLNWNKNKVKFYHKLAIMANSVTSLLELLEYLNILEDCKNKIITIENSSHLASKARVNLAWLGIRMINFIQDYFMQVYTIKNSSIDTYNLFKRLAFGAMELRTLGNFLGLNLGLPTSPVDLLTKVNSIETCIENIVNVHKAETRRSGFPYNLLKRAEKDENEYRFNLIEFIDNPNYRKEIINDYQYFKENFNILEVMITDPQYFGYLSRLKEALKTQSNISSKLRALRTGGILAAKLQNAVSSLDISDINKRVGRLVEDYLRDSWLLSSPYAKFTLPAGLFQYTEDLATGKLTLSLVKTTSPKTIQLGTKAGNATFKLYMESYVIPRILNNRDKSNKKVNTFVNNLFIHGLRPLAFTNITLDYSPMAAYSLPINMSPRTPFERALHAKYKESFSKLTGSKYNFGEYNLYNLFYLYNLIAFNDIRSTSTLSTIFDDIDSDIARDKLKFYHDFDLNSSILFEGNVPITEANISKSLLIEYTRLRRNPYSTKLNHIYGSDRDSLSLIPYDKSTGQEFYDMEGYEGAEEYIGPNTSKKGLYEANYTKADWRALFDREFKFESIKFNKPVEVKLKGNIIKSIKLGSKSIKLSGEAWLPIKLDLQNIIVDYSEIDKIIEHSMCKI